MECGYFGFVKHKAGCRPVSPVYCYQQVLVLADVSHCFPVASLCWGIMMKTCTAAVTCKDISYLNLRLSACTEGLSKSLRLWMHLCCCMICIQVRYHIAHSLCPGNKTGVWPAQPQALSETSCHSCQAVAPGQPPPSLKSNLVQLMLVTT